MSAPAWLVAQPIAHRGLHDVSAGVIEPWTPGMAIADSEWTRGSTTTQAPAIATSTSPRTVIVRADTGPRRISASARVPTHAALSPSSARHRAATSWARSGSDPGT